MEALETPKNLTSPRLPPPSYFWLGVWRRTTPRKTLAQAYLHLCVSLLLQLSHTYSDHQFSEITESLDHLHSCHAVDRDPKGVCGCPGPYFATSLAPSRYDILVHVVDNRTPAQASLASVLLTPLKTLIQLSPLYASLSLRAWESDVDHSVHSRFVMSGLECI